MYQTKVHTRLIEFLNQSNSGLPFFDFRQIQNHLSQFGLKPNKTTLYRQLSILEKDNRIHSKQIQGKQVWSNLEHVDHNHFVCNDCNVIECVDIPKAITQSIIDLTQNMFDISTVRLEGVCKQCKNI